MDKHQIIIAGAVCAMLFGAAGFWLGRSIERGAAPALNVSGSGGEPALSTGGLDISGVTLAGGNAIAINDQQPANALNIAMVTLAQDGWVVIHAEHGGKPGNILGARRFNAGQNQSGTVELLRPTEEGKVYFAMLHLDDGDRQFDYAKDLPINDLQGNAIMMRFIATANSKEQ